MRELVFMPNAWQDLAWWMKNDVKSAKKIHKILTIICRTPFEGIGKPEALKTNYAGYWSRRINLEHRIVYKVEPKRIVAHSLYGHYQK